MTRICEMGMVRAARWVCSLSQLKSDLSDFSHLKVTNPAKPSSCGGGLSRLSGNGEADFATLPSPTSSVLALRAWGGVGGGGAFFSFFVCKCTPTPSPSPQPPRDAGVAGTPAGGGERTEFAAHLSRNYARSGIK